MALLRRTLLVLAVACSGSCESSRSLGHVEASLSSSGDSRIDGEPIAAQAFIDPDASRYAPNGLYVYFEFDRSDGRHAQVELDVPTDAPEAGALTQFEASYRELDAERVRFASSRVQGQIVVPGSGAAVFDPICGCDDTGFALSFIDAGEDGDIGTRDDALRRLSFGRVGWADSFCRSREDLSIPDDLRLRREHCHVATATPPVMQPEPAPEPTLTAAPAPSCTDCYDTTPIVTTNSGCDAQSDDEVDYEDGCSSTGTTAPSNEPESSSSTSADTSSDSSSGCEGDSTDSSDQGCEGDSSDDDKSSCSVAHAQARARHQQIPSSFAGTGLPLLIACLIQVGRARRSRACARKRHGIVPASSGVPGAT